MFSNDFRISSLKHYNKVEKGYKTNKDPKQNKNTFANKSNEDRQPIKNKDNTQKKNENGNYNFYV